MLPQEPRTGMPSRSVALAHGTVPQRSRHSLRVRYRGQRDRGRRLGADGSAHAGSCPAHGSLGYELAAVAGEGGFELSELVVPSVPEQSTEPPDQPD